ncbi:12118_t:CDS:2 [Dentiscutata heterogama]|uniref:12118_t:CDS:1 n=1 Tax=Dentiscutata heterogama TaxID=1316150 RepID=A0ACA9KUI7_9GLOM|nr:12118_t:CDS:2 [Dentiscutata heterogama]
MEQINKNNVSPLPKQSTSSTLTVPKMAFGSSMKTAHDNTFSHHGFSSQQIYPDSTSGVFNNLSQQDTFSTEESYNNIITDTTSFPPLEKVLMNKTGSPLSQYNFYSYLQQEWQGEENLNFWLDVVTHENLFESWRDVDDTGTTSVDSQNPVMSHNHISSTQYGHEIAIPENYKSRSYSQLKIVKRVDEEDLTKSALNIYRKYGHMSILPEENRNTMADLIERQGRYNPVVFSSAKSYVHHIMNVIYFPKFIQSAVEMNITQVHAILALPLGIMCLTLGFSLDLYYIFMGLENRLIRFYGFPAIWLGWIFLQTAATRFSPIFSIFGVSECKFLNFHKIRERSVLLAHRKRFLKLIMWDTLASIITVGILFLIPPISLYEKS